LSTEIRPYILDIHWTRGVFAVGRAIRDARLDSPSARAKLKPSGKPYWRLIDTGLHLGYRRGRTGGSWNARRYLGEERYEVEKIGEADDVQAADGRAILTFSQAQGAARAWAVDKRKPKGQGPYTVGKALDAYAERLEAEHKKSLSDTRNRIENDIRPQLGEKLVDDLAREELARWLKQLADRPRRVRGKKGKKARDLAKPGTDDERRRRRASANRTMTVLRAALNQAFREGKAHTDSAWRTVKPFREVERARVRYFTTDEIKRLVNAAQGPFRALVNAALFTGCRYGELARMRVGDFNPDAGTVFVGQSKSGKARHVVLTDEGQRFFSQITAGKSTDALMLPKTNGSAWAASHQLRPMEEACKAAKIPRAGFHILRHTAASHLVMSGVPMPVVAQNLGHADSRMTEKHYAHLAPSYLAEQIRKFAPTFGTVEEGNVEELRRA
jgi:integrase